MCIHSLQKMLKIQSIETKCAFLFVGTKRPLFESGKVYASCLITRACYRRFVIAWINSVKLLKKKAEVWIIYFSCQSSKLHMWSSLLKYAWCKQFSKKLKGTIFPKWLHWIGLEAGLKRTNNSQTKTLSLSVTRAVRHLPFSFNIRRYYLFILVTFLVFKSHVL